MNYPGPGQPWGGQPQQQPPYGQQYPQQQYMPPQQQPWTLPGWGAIPAVIGTVLIVIGIFAIDWTDGGGSYVDAAKPYVQAYDKDLVPPDKENGFVFFYLKFGIFGFAAAQAMLALMWSLGSVRGRVSAFLTFGIWGAGLRAGRLNGARIALTVVCVLFTALHVTAWVMWTDLVGADIGDLEAGAWLTLAGLVLTTIGCAVGPRSGFAQPPLQPMPPGPYGYR
ncbi:hypothetical protein EV193_108110 [Herbihabitans rhizosphaerae]|uniref:Uncharacterized protein n=1 Tax=Herbihabitans rhizosphaerae TaxID=1872711 RepID=A0A4Q7KHK8_9PSEU|nr:hypothetical protein [Herbihabitans rhizosphaerae]RZS34762.1 hypothetical protein EV193_108110 [Herbihabitans rhizosphaerae]